MKFLAITLLAIGLVACHDNNPTGPHGDVTGIYVLRKIDGVALPTAGNGISVTYFTIIADTIRVHEDGFATEVIVTTLPGFPAIQRSEHELEISYGPGHVTFEANYPCKDYFALAATSCIAPPHHTGLRSSNGMTFTHSVMYRVPMDFERVGPILPE